MKSEINKFVLDFCGVPKDIEHSEHQSHIICQCQACVSKCNMIIGDVLKEHEVKVEE